MQAKSMTTATAVKNILWFGIRQDDLWDCKEAESDDCNLMLKLRNVLVRGRRSPWSIDMRIQKFLLGFKAREVQFGAALFP